MHSLVHSIARAIAILAAAGSLAVPLAASAAVPGQAQLRGTITAIAGKYELHVQDDNGEIDDVRLHRGTIINPTGLTLRPGMRVTILGNPQGQTFAANEIDTPYHVAYDPLYQVWGGPGWGGPFWGERFGGRF